MSKEDDESRLRAVEEAVIEFRNIAKIVIVDLKERVRTLESRDEEFSKMMYTSCDLKTKEIDTKIKESKDDIYKDIRSVKNSLIKMIVVCFSVTASMFLLFIGAVVYFNNQDGIIHEKINVAHKESARIESTNIADIKTILSELKYIRGKIDKNVHNHK